MRNNLIFYLLVVHLSCSNGQSRQDCVELSNLSNKYFTNYLFSKDVVDLNFSYQYVKKALACNPTRPVNHWLKIKILAARQSYDSALIAISNFQKINNGPDIKFTKGEVFSRLGKVDSATLLYKDAKNGYCKLLVNQPDNSSLILGFLQVVFRLEGKDKAIEIAKKYKSKYPQKEEFQSPEKLIQSLDYQE